MAMVVKNNMSAVRTLNTLNANTSALQKSLQKVSSGMKINSAQDDASGYAISERMRVRIRSLDQANQNTQNDASLMKTAEGAVGNTVEILRALKEKAINAANDSNTDEDRQTIQKEINQFIDQIDDNALVQFNGKYLIDGSKNNATISSKSILLNQSLQAGTLETADLTTLRNRAGDSLGIQTSDKWQVSWVENGKITFASGNVGNKSLEDILNASWATGTKTETVTNDDGTTTTVLSTVTFGQVKATTDDGLISKGSPTYEPAGEWDGTTAPDALNNALQASDAYLQTQGSGVTPAAGTVKLSDLGFYKDEDGTAFDSNVVVNWDAGGAVTSIENLDATSDSPVTLYAEKAAVPNVTESTATLVASVDITVNNSGASTAASDTSTLTGIAAEAVALSSLKDSNYPANGSYTSNTAVDKTAKLSDIKDADGNTKYYLKTSDGEVVAADDVTITRTKTPDGTNLKTDVLTFSLTNTDDKYGSGVTVTSLKLYEAAGGGTGFDDAPDKFGKAVYTPDKTAGIAVASNGDGVNNQLSGLTISILDQDGNVKKAANAALDQFKQYQRAENQTGDMSLNFHIGSEANVAIKVGMSDMRSEALGLKGSDGTRIDVYTKEHANSAINVIENALTKALDQQTTIGAIEARLEYTSTNLTTSSENVQAAESTIRDADMAKEMTNYTKSNVLLQAAQAMLAQANQNSSAVLSLLQ